MLLLFQSNRSNTSCLCSLQRGMLSFQRSLTRSSLKERGGLPWKVFLLGKFKPSSKGKTGERSIHSTRLEPRVSILDAILARPVEPKRRTIQRTPLFPRASHLTKANGLLTKEFGGKKPEGEYAIRATAVACIESLLDVLPDVDMAELGDRSHYKLTLIVDVDAPEPLPPPESAVADGLPILQHNLDNYTQYLAQYKAALREELCHKVRKVINSKAQVLSGSFNNCKVTFKNGKLVELHVPVNASDFRDEADYFSNMLLLLSSSATANPGSACDEPAKLRYGVGNFTFNPESDSEMGQMHISVRPQTYQQLVGKLPDKETNESVELNIQWTLLETLTPYLRKTLACSVQKQKRPIFWEQICKGTSLPRSETIQTLTLCSNLNDTQNDAVNRLVSSSKGVHFMIGPPGTGKTSALVEVLKGLVAKSPKKRVLVVAPSNRGVQVAAEKFIQSAPEESLPFAMIVGRMEKVPDGLSHLHEKNIVTHMLAPLRELAADVDSDLSTLAEKFKTAAALTQARLNRVLHSPVSAVPVPRELLLAVSALDQDKTFISVRDLKDDTSSLLKAVSEPLQKLNTQGKGLIDRAQIVFSTLVNSGSPHLASFKFNTVVLDEASQTDLPEAMIPVTAFKPNLWIQIGDPNQLGAVITSPEIEKKGYAESMLSRAASAMPNDVLALTEQYRMHPAIRKWISDQSYNGKLVENESILTRSSPLALLPTNVALSGLPSAFVNVKGTESMSETFRPGVGADGDNYNLVHGVDESTGGLQGTSLINPVEARAVVDTVRFLLRHGVPPESIAVISFYAAQMLLIKSLLHAVKEAEAVYVGTVDGCQGDERDFVLVSCVRTSFHVGFLKDSRRLNVALSRAKHARWVFGHVDTLRHSGSDFSEMLDWVNDPLRNNTSPPTGVLEWSKIKNAIKFNTGESARVQLGNKAAPAAKRTSRQTNSAQNLAKTGTAVMDEENSVTMHDASIIPTLPVGADRNWLIDRMAKLGYCPGTVQQCHEKLVNEQGFVQESAFAALAGDNVNGEYLSDIGITSSGAQVFLMRLHRELRAQYVS